MRLLVTALSLLTLGAQSHVSLAQTTPACQINPPPANCAEFWATSAQISVPNGAYVDVPDPGCLNDMTGEVQRITAVAIAAAKPELAQFAGPISQATAPMIDRALRNQGGDLGRMFSPYAKNGAMCAPLVVVVPVKSQVWGYRLLATDGHNGNVFQGCPGDGGDCGIGWSAFQAEPVVQGNDKVKTATTIFKNWSHDRPRTARMIIFFKMPPGDRPLVQM